MDVLPTGRRLVAAPHDPHVGVWIQIRGRSKSLQNSEIAVVLLSNICTIDVWTTGTLERLEDRLADLCGHRNTLDALLVRLVAEALETGAWEMPGIHSPAHWLAWKAGLSASHAQQLVTVARRRDELPVTFAAFDAGELSLDQVLPIVDQGAAVG